MEFMDGHREDDGHREGVGWVEIWCKPSRKFSFCEVDGHLQNFD